MARLARVSQSTASRALNGRNDVSPATRATVVEAANTLGFRPHPVARSLRMRRSSIVGLVVPDVAHPFYAATLKGAEEVLEQSGYRLMLMDSGQDPRREAAALALLLEHQVDGLLLCTAGLPRDEFAATVGADAAPCIFIDDIVPGAGSGTVRIENARGMALLVDHLVGTHALRRIALLVGPDQGTSGAERRHGFEDAVRRHGIGPDGFAVRECAWTVESARAAARDLLAGRGAPQAVVTASAELALGVLAAAGDLGVAIPEDVVLTCFDDPYYGRYLDPSLTSVAYDAADLGREAARMLVAAIDDPEAAPGEHRIGVRLEVRRSCGCPGEAVEGWATARAAG